ncbi:MAG TPA: DNA-processing protein DprA [Acetobacteraceae bacterium]
MTPAESLDRLRLARTDGVGPVTYRRLLRRYATAAEALDALPGLAQAGGKKDAPAVPTASAARKEMDHLAKLGGRMVFLDGPGYSPALAAFDPAPPLLSVIGNAALLTERAVALVGARNASVNGQRMAELLASDLAMAGLVVVSGMARGVDAAAHEGALRTGRTIAAVAGGVDVPYPPENAGLQRRVAEWGAVVAEAPLGTAPQARHFPRRNRVIAGLSLGVVVIEAAPRSGSLITAQIALDEGRAVFAVPGSPLDPRCRGSNNLLREGAVLTESAADVMGHLPMEVASPMPPGFAEDPAPFDAPIDIAAVVAQVAPLLSASPTPVDDLVRRCQLSVHAVQAALMALELNHRVQMLPGNQVSLIG